MKIGTKSVLFGAHCFLIHPLFVFASWWKLYGFTWDPRLWISFFVHDIGYFGKPNMDGPEGENHVLLGARIMGFLFDRKRNRFNLYYNPAIFLHKQDMPFTWEGFTRYHSRFYAKLDGVKPSKLCFADKLSMCMEPDWFYLFRVRLSGEIDEYMKLAKTRNLAGEKLNEYENNMLRTNAQRDWRKACVSYVERWVYEHIDGREDTWTPKSKISLNDHGIYI